MKTLLFSLLSLPLIFSMEVQATAIEKSVTQLPAAHPGKKLSASMPFEIKLGTTIDKENSYTIQNSAVRRQFPLYFPKYIKNLADKVGIKENGAIHEIDISYPAFLDFVRSRCEGLRAKKPKDINKLITYIYELINPDTIKNEATLQSYFDELFEIPADFAKNYNSTDDEDDSDDEAVPPSKSECYEKLKSIFLKGYQNLTCQQRLKTLLILREIANLNLADDFGVKSLQKIACYLSKTGYGMTPLSTKPMLHFSITDRDDSVMVIPSSGADSDQKTRTTDVSSLNHELCHLYHNIINSAIGVANPLSQMTPEPHPFCNGILFPFHNERTKENTKRLFQKALDEKWEKAKDEICNTIVKRVQELCEKEGWATLEEALTITGAAPIVHNSKPYVIYDRQNQGAEMKRDIDGYRLLHIDKKYIDEELKEKIAQLLAPDDIVGLLSKALVNSGYQIYASGENVVKNSPLMEEAENNFRKFAGVAPSDATHSPTGSLETMTLSPTKLPLSTGD